MGWTKQHSTRLPGRLQKEKQLSRPHSQAEPTYHRRFEQTTDHYMRHVRPWKSFWQSVPRRHSTHQMKLLIDNTQIPMEPHPLFLGIKLDPKLSYSEHQTHISHKIANRVNLIRKVKGLKLNNQVYINIIIKSLVRSIIDYAFMPLISSTQRILDKVQTIQNNTLRTIKRFPLRSITAESLQARKDRNPS